MLARIYSYIERTGAFFERGWRFITHDVWYIGKPGETVPNGLIIKQIRAVVLLAQGLIEETLLLRASALTFATLLFLVPFFTMMFYLIQAFSLGDHIYERMDEQLYKAVVAFRSAYMADASPDGSEGEEDRDSAGLTEAPDEEANTRILGAFVHEPGKSDELLKEQLIGMVFPILAGEQTITDDPMYQNPVKLLVGLAEEGARSPQTIGISGLLFILSTVFGFMRNVEYTFNRIWGVKRQRNPLRVISHYMMITLLLPFVAAFIMGINAALESQSISDMLGSLTTVVRVFQFIVLGLAFTLVYQFVPNTRVYFRYALLGGIVGAALYMLNSWAYVKFQYGLVRYTSFFSTFALFPLLLMYIYFSWLILLFGSLVSFAYQNEKTFAMERMAEDATQAYREALAVRLMIEVTRRFNRARYPLEVREAAERWNVPTRLVSDTLEALMKANLVVACATTPVTYQPARAMRKVKILDVVNAMRTFGQDPSLLRDDAEYRELYLGLDRADPSVMQSDIDTVSRTLYGESGDKGNASQKRNKRA